MKDIETQSKLHNIRNKAILGIKLTTNERNLYLLHCNSIEEIKEFKKLIGE